MFYISIIISLLFFFYLERVQWNACDIRPIFLNESGPRILDENGHQVQRFVGFAINFSLYTYVSHLCEYAFNIHQQTVCLHVMLTVYQFKLL